MALQPTPENIRAEMARYRLTRRDVAKVAGMHQNQWSQFSTGRRPLQAWAAHNMAWAVNHLAGLRLLDVPMDEGLRTPVRGGWKRPTGGTKRDG